MIKADGGAPIKIAAAQIVVGLDKPGNVRKISDLASLASKQGAKLVVFPEAAMYNYGTGSHPLVLHAEPLDGPFVKALGRIAKENSIFIAAGMFESIPGEQYVFNTVVVINAAGATIGCYRKIHLYNAFGWKESDRFKAGDGSILTFQCADTKFGVMTCYDLRFPELARQLAACGTQAILVPAAWVSGPLKETHLEILVRARAIENNLYLVSAVQIGPTFSGESKIVDPMGVVVAGIGEDEGLIVAELNPDRVASVRDKSPTLKNCRPELYAQWYAAEAASRKPQ